MWPKELDPAARLSFTGRESLEVLKAASPNESWCSRLRAAGSSNVAAATILVTWSSEAPVLGLIDALELYVESTSLDPAATFFWICDFCVRQAADDDSTAPDVVRSGEMIREIGHTVLYLEGWSSSPPALTRSWILWELFNSADPGVTFGVAMTKREQGTQIQMVTASVYT